MRSWPFYAINQLKRASKKEASNEGGGGILERGGSGEAAVSGVE